MRGKEYSGWDWIAIWVTLFLAVGFLVGVVAYNVTYHQPAPIHATISAPSVRPLVQHVWTKVDSLAYAHDQVIKDAQAQFICLKVLWNNESKWNPKAFNNVKVMGKNAGGIPQILGLSPLTPPTLQIERGLSYIYFRHVTACKAWYHWQKKGWY